MKERKLFRDNKHDWFAVLANCKLRITQTQKK